jgi:hypothetical protein
VYFTHSCVKNALEARQNTRLLYLSTRVLIQPFSCQRQNQFRICDAMYKKALL